MIFDFGNMLHWALIFLVIALVAGLLGFTSVAGTAMEGAKMLCGVAVFLLILAVIFNFARAIK